jgi:YD repeat-containing protein
VVDEDGTHDFLYDLRGLVQTQTVTGEGTYTYGYDAVGRNTSLAFPDGHTRIQGWDAEGRLMSRCYQYSDPSKTRCYGATYDAAGNPLTLTDPEGTDTVEYDALYRVKKVTRSSPGIPGERRVRSKPKSRAEFSSRRLDMALQHKIGLGYLWTCFGTMR